MVKIVFAYGGGKNSLFIVSLQFWLVNKLIWNFPKLNSLLFAKFREIPNLFGFCAS